VFFLAPFTFKEFLGSLSSGGFSLHYGFSPISTTAICTDELGFSAESQASSGKSSS